MTYCPEHDVADADLFLAFAVVRDPSLASLLETKFPIPLSLWERAGVRVLPSRLWVHPHPAFGRPLPGGEAKGHMMTFTKGQLLNAPRSDWRAT
jgi:hypothetical protein